MSLTLTACEREREHQAWRGGRRFREADCLRLLSLSIKLVCVILSRGRSGIVSNSLDNSDTHECNAGRGPASTRPQDCASARPALPARPGRQSYKLHIGGIGGGPEPAELQATQWRLQWRTGDVARRRRWRTGSRRTSREPAAGVMDRLQEPGLGELESSPCWTGTSCRTAPLACSD